MCVCVFPYSFFMDTFYQELLKWNYAYFNVCFIIPNLPCDVKSVSILSSSTFSRKSYPCWYYLVINVLLHCCFNLNFKKLL